MNKIHFVFFLVLFLSVSFLSFADNENYTLKRTAKSDKIELQIDVNPQFAQTEKIANHFTDKENILVEQIDADTIILTYPESIENEIIKHELAKKFHIKIR